MANFMDQVDALVKEILALELINPISGHDVEPDDVYQYIDENAHPDNKPCSVKGFKEWLATDQ